MKNEIKNENYIVIHGWMLNTMPDLTFQELGVYALIYGFSQDGKSEYGGGLQYIADWCKLSRKDVAKRILDRLVERGYVKRKEFVVNNVKFVNYSAIVNSIHHECMGYTESVRGEYIQSVHPVHPKCTNNIIKESINNNINNNIVQNPNFERKSEEKTIDDFETFWEMYDKKRGKEKCLRIWQRLSQKDRKEILDKTPAYINATPDKQFRKDPSTYLNPKNKCWNDEIIKNDGNGTNRTNTNQHQQRTDPPAERTYEYGLF